MLAQNLKAHQLLVHKKVGPIKGQNTLDSFFCHGASKKRGVDVVDTSPVAVPVKVSKNRDIENDDDSDASKDSENNEGSDTVLRSKDGECETNNDSELDGEEERNMTTTSKEDKSIQTDLEYIASFETINMKLNHAVKKITSNIDYSDCKTEEEKALKAIGVVTAGANVVTQIKSVEESIGDLKQVVGLAQNEEHELKRTVKERMDSVRSINGLSQNFPEFEYNTEDGCIKCVICRYSFQYGANLKNNFLSCPMSVEFSSLKRNLSKHLETAHHMSQLKKMKQTS